jgi:hypothetical protein
MTFFAYKFYRRPTDEKTAKRLFWMSLVHLPALVALMLLHKREWPRSAESKHSVEHVVHEPFGVHVFDHK